MIRVRRRRAAPFGAGALTVLGLAVAAVVIGGRAPISGQQDEFNATVRPVLTGTCATCHNAELPSGGMSVDGLNSAESLVGQRQVWEKILERLRAGEMPPEDVARPAPERMAAMIAYIERALER